ncbi:MAG: glycine-rich protein [Acidimicrobiales bacterium]|nr:glycine-rich protein [Acidimicrobiales bacterium]
MRKTAILVLGLLALAGGTSGQFIDLGPEAPALGAVAGVAVEAPLVDVELRFGFTGANQYVAVPADVTSLQVSLCGAAAGSAGADGFGDRVESSVEVTPGRVVTLRVGGAGVDATGGWNGGQDADAGGSGGGGATDLRVGGDQWDDRAVVARGGGVNGGGIASLGSTVVEGDCAGDGQGIIRFRTAEPTMIRPHGVLVRTEGSTGQRMWRLPVLLTVPADREVSADWVAKSDVGLGHAAPGRDYELASGSITWAPGETLAYVEIVVLGDDVHEMPLYGGEWGVVEFDNIVNAELDTSAFFGLGLFVIRDDD